MLSEAGPVKFQKIKFNSGVIDICASRSQPILLAATQDSKLEQYYLSDFDKNGLQTRALAMRCIQVDQNPTYFNFGKKQIVYCQDNLLRISNKRQIVHQSKITNLLADNQDIAITTSLNNILISQISKGEQQAQLSSEGEIITSISWNNSLVMSGDNSGKVNLWDINKQFNFYSKKAHSQRVDIINAYADYINTNVFYTVSKKERKIGYHDLRTYKSIKVIEKLPYDLVDVQHNSSGKILLASQKQTLFIDIYRNFKTIGSFRELNVTDNSQKFSRKINKMIIWDKFGIVGCDNGCIQIYDTDLLKTIYSFGVCQETGVKSMHRIQNSLIVLSQNGLVTIVKLA